MGRDREEVRGEGRKGEELKVKGGEKKSTLGNEKSVGWGGEGGGGREEKRRATKGRKKLREREERKDS